MQARIHRGPVLALILAVLSSCAPGATGPSPAPSVRAAVSSPSPQLVLDVPAERATLQTYEIPPQDTDSAIDGPLDPHFVAIDPSVKPRGELFVWLPGTGIKPANNSLIVRQAAANGFHAIGLGYSSALTVQSLCAVNPDEGCFEKLRLDIVDGAGRATSIKAVSPAAGILNRLTKLLIYLGARFPNDGWSAYLAAGTPRWSAIRLGGHSQGGGEAAIIARDHEVARVCIAEGAIDLIGAPGGDRRLPSWIGSPHITPADRYFGFHHARSDNPNAEAFPLAWAALGITQFGAAVDSSAVRPPYNGSHYLTVNGEPVGPIVPLLFHGSVVVDRMTPRTPSGQPLYAPVWQYECFD